MYASRNFGEQLAHLQREHLLLRIEWLRLKRAHYVRKYDPNQPRVPAGNPDGGQWTSTGGIWTPGIADLSATDWNATAEPVRFPLPNPMLPLPLLPPNGVPTPEPINDAATLYEWMSRRNTPDRRAVLAFRADLFTSGTNAKDPAIRVGTLTEDQVAELCPRFFEVQAITDRAARTIDRGRFAKPQDYGTAVHKWIKDDINGPATVPASPPRDPDFRAEVSVLKMAEATYGKRDTIRVDVYENPRTGTVCIYDIKTGPTRLTPARMLELATNAQFLYPGVKRLVVTEVRPTP